MPLKIFASKKSQKIVDKLVLAVGGGSIIDQAKIYAKKNKKICIAIPTTGAGASMTSHSVVWTEKKTNIKTDIPITVTLPIKIKLDKKTRRDTTADMLGHIVDYVNVCSDTELIEVGNFAGKLIEKHPTNLTHHMSYPLTLKYGVPHGEAVASVLPECVKQVCGL